MIKVDFQSMITLSSRRSEGPTGDAVSEGTEGKLVVGLPTSQTPGSSWRSCWGRSFRLLRTQIFGYGEMFGGFTWGKVYQGVTAGPSQSISLIDIIVYVPDLFVWIP